MGMTYFKRFRMEIDLRDHRCLSPVPSGYRLVPWEEQLLSAHAEVKYLSFQSEIDARVFPCLGEPHGCARLMEEISHKAGFVPEATWLIEYVGDGPDRREFCGTIQGIRLNSRYGGIQNVGVTPFHRSRGLGKRLLDFALAGFQHVGLRRAALEVTAQNQGAVRLYQRYGFRRTKTLYKAADVVWA